MAKKHAESRADALINMRDKNHFPYSLALNGLPQVCIFVSCPECFTVDPVCRLVVARVDLSWRVTSPYRGSVLVALSRDHVLGTNPRAINKESIADVCSDTMLSPRTKESCPLKTPFSDITLFNPVFQV